MQIIISGDAEMSIKRHLAAGDYQSAEEVIAAAMTSLDESDNSAPTMESLQSKIEAGLDDIKAGRVIPLDAADIKKRGRERLTQSDVFQYTQT